MFLKDPSAVLYYELDWSDHLGEHLIEESQWTIVPEGLSMVGHTVNEAVCSVRLGGGEAGCLYRATNRVELSDGSVDERSIVVRVEQR